MLSVPSDFKDFIHTSEGTSFWNSPEDEEDLLSPLHAEQKRAELVSDSSPGVSLQDWMVVCSGYLGFGAAFLQFDRKQ